MYSVGASAKSCPVRCPVAMSLTRCLLQRLATSATHPTTGNGQMGSGKTPGTCLEGRTVMHTKPQPSAAQPSQGHMPFCRIHIPRPPPACRFSHCPGIASLSSTCIRPLCLLVISNERLPRSEALPISRRLGKLVCQLSGHRSRGHTASLHTPNHSLSRPKLMHDTLPLDAVKAVSSQRCPSAEILH